MELQGVARGFYGVLLYQNFVTDRAVLALGQAGFGTGRCYRLVNDFGMSVGLDRFLLYENRVTDRAIVECNVSPLFHGSGIGKLVAATGIVVNPGYTCRHLDLGVGNPAESTSINRLNAVFNDNFFDLLQIGRPRRVVIVLSQASRASAPIKPQGITLKRPANICSPGTADFAADCTPVAGIWLVVCRRDDGILQRDFGSCGNLTEFHTRCSQFKCFQSCICPIQNLPLQNEYILQGKQPFCNNDITKLVV